MAEIGPFNYLEVYPSTSGSMRLEADVTWDEMRAIASDMERERIPARTEIWAGPYDLFFAIVDTSLNAIGAGTGIVALLMEFAKKRPERPLKIHIDNSRTVIINGTDQLGEADARAVEDLFREHDVDPQSDEWKNPGPRS